MENVKDLLASAECWNCGGEHFITGVHGLSVCVSCKEVQDDEEELYADHRYDHW